MVIVWTVIGVVVGGGLLAAAWYDRTTRRRGRQTRDTNDMVDLTRERRADMKGTRWGSIPTMDTYRAPTDPTRRPGPGQ